MSRRHRRKAAVAKGKPSTRWLVRAGVAGFVLLVLALGGGYVALRGWLHGGDFRRMLAVEAGKAIGATAEFGPFRWSGTSMDTESFTAAGDGVVRAIDAEGLRVDVGLGGWWQGVWRVTDARARRITMEIDATAADRATTAAAPAPETPPPPAKADRWYDALIPDRVEVDQIEVGNSAVTVVTRSGPVGIAGTSWRVTPDLSPGSYRAEGSGGSVKLPWKWAPRMELGQARLRYHDDSVSLAAADFRVYESGRLDLSGEMSVKGDGYDFDGHLRDVMCAEVLPEDWKQRLSGKVESEFTVGSGSRGPVVEGHLELTDGVVTALPLLDALSAYADTTRFRRVALQEGRVDYEWEDGALALRDLVLSSEGLVRVEGRLRVDREERLDGTFRLGLVPGVLARIPGAETIVFSPGERGLLWTTVRVTGTVDDPKEDLTARLIEAAGMRMIEIIPETGEKVLKFTRQVLDEDLAGHLKNSGAGVIEQGREVIREAEGVVREAQGIFDIIRGKDEDDE
jgi:hypothetical protein